jgi:small subunit ribosomal protein S17
VSEAVTEQTRGRRKTMIGTVVSVKMDKTAVVAVERRYPHPLYHKIIRSTKRYKAHDPNNAAVLGDVVRIVESRPISKEKRWRIMETMTRGNVADLQPREIAMPDEAMLVRQAPATPTTAQVADETPMTTDSTVLAAASDDMDASDYAAEEEDKA